MTNKECDIAYAIWQAQAANAIGRTNATKRAIREGIRSAAHHVACTLYRSSAERAMFITQCGFDPIRYQRSN